MKYLFPVLFAIFLLSTYVQKSYALDTQKALTEVRKRLSKLNIRHKDMRIIVQKNDTVQWRAYELEKTIVITRGVFRWAHLVGDFDAVMAIVLHEIGHVRKKHRFAQAFNTRLRQEIAADAFAIKHLPQSACFLNQFLKARILGKISKKDREIARERVRILSSACKNKNAG